MKKPKFLRKRYADFSLGELYLCLGALCVVTQTLYVLLRLVADSKFVFHPVVYWVLAIVGYLIFIVLGVLTLVFGFGVILRIMDRREIKNLIKECNEEVKVHR